MLIKEGDLRMLGAVDGFAHALIRVRQEIGSKTYYPISKRHTRKIAAREEMLKPLRQVENWLVDRHQACLAAYNATTEWKEF